MESPVIMAGGGMRTKPLIPEMCFATTTEEDSESEKPPATPYLEEDGTSLLVSCSNCSIRVHTSQCPVRLRQACSVDSRGRPRPSLRTTTLPHLCGCVSGCYGVDPATVSKDWKCARCKANAMTEVSAHHWNQCLGGNLFARPDKGFILFLLQNCCLCSLRGGALQKANNNK